jgi:sulfite exporter TauE/SafE
LAQLTDIYNSDLYLLPWITFLVGLAGSVHCIGMCGGLASGCTTQKNGNLFYQLGRLISYSLLGLFSGLVGSFLLFKGDSFLTTLLPAISIGLIMVFWGLKPWLPTLKLSLPAPLRKVHSRLWIKYLGPKYRGNAWSTFMVGSLSIFLPCGLLYGVVLALASFHHPLMGMISMLTFGLGTLPAMSFAPEIIKKIISPLKTKMPFMFSFLLIGFGVGTIGFRIYTYMETGQCH